MARALPDVKSIQSLKQMQGVKDIQNIQNTRYIKNVKQPLDYTLPEIKQTPVLPKIEQLSNLPTLPSLKKLPNLSSLIKSKRANKQVSPFSDYNDTDSINSIADIIWNSVPGLPGYRRTENKTFKFVNSDKFRRTPVVNLVGTVLDIADHVYRHTVIPIQQGNPTALLMNALQDLGETGDLLANPVKGAVIEGFKQGPEGIAKGLYKGSYGRTNYDYDTGNLLSDFALELVSDPFNWISFGASSGLKTLASVGSESLQEAAELTLKKGSRVLIDQTIDLASDNGKRKLAKLIKSINRSAVDDFADLGGDITKILRQKGSGIFTQEFMDTVVDLQLKKLNKMDSISFFIKQGLIKTARVTEPIESGLFRAAAWTSCIPTPYLIKQIKKAFPVATDVLADHIFKSMQVITGLDNPLDIKYIRTTLGLKDKIQKEFDDFQKYSIHLSDKVPLIQIENGFKSHAYTKLLAIKNNLKNATDLTNRNSLYQILFSIMPSDEVTAIAKSLNKDFNELDLIKLLNKCGYEGTNIYDCSLNAFKNNIKALKDLNLDYDNAFIDIEKAYTKQLKELREVFEEAKAKELIKVMLDDLNVSNPGIKKYLAETITEYNKNLVQHQTILNNYPIFTSHFKAENKKLYDAITINASENNLINSGNTARVIKNNITESIKLIQKHQDDLLKFNKEYNLGISKEFIINFYSAIKKAVLENSSVAKLADIFNKFEGELTDIYQNSLNLKLITEKGNTLLKDVNLIRTIKDSELFSATQKSVDKVRMSLVDSLEGLRKLGPNADTETIVSNIKTEIIEQLKELKEIKPEAKYSKLGLFDISETIEKHINKLEDIYNNADLDKLASETAQEIQKTINDLSVITDTVETFVNKTIPRLQEQYSNANSLRATIKKAKSLQNSRLRFNEKAVNKALNTSEDSMKALHDLHSLREKKLNPLPGINNSGVILEAKNKSLKYDLVTDTDVSKLLNDMFNPDSANYFDFGAELQYIQDNAYKIITSGVDLKDSVYFSDFFDSTDILKKYYDKITKGVTLTTVEKEDLVSTLDNLKYNLYYLKSLSEKPNKIEISGLFKIELKELSDTIQNAMDFLGNFRASVVKEKLIQLNADDVLYAAAINKAHNIKTAYADNMGIKRITHAFYDVDGIYHRAFQFLKQNAEDTGNVAMSDILEQVEAFFERYTAVESFITDLYTDDTLKPVADALFDSTVKMDNISVIQFLNNFDYIVDKIIANADTFTQTTNVGKSLSIDALVRNTWKNIKLDNFPNKEMKQVWESFSKEEKEFFKQIGEFGETHGALDDVKITELYLRLTSGDKYFYSSDGLGEAGNNIFYNNAGGKVNIIDIETTGLQVNSNIVTEFAMKQAGNDSNTINLRLKISDEWFPPDPNVVRTKFPDMPEDIAMKKFVEYHTPELNPGVTFVDSLDEMAERICLHFGTLNVNDSVIGHNIKNFDLKSIQNFIDYVNDIGNTNYYLPYHPTAITFNDSYQDMLSELVPSMITPEMKRAYKHHLESLVRQLQANSTTDALFKPASAADSKLIIELDKAFKNSIAKESSGTRFATEIEQAISELKGKLNDFITQTDAAALKENQLLFTKSAVQSEEAYDIYKANLRRSIGELMTTIKSNTLKDADLAKAQQKLNLAKYLLKTADDTPIPYLNPQMFMYSNLSKPSAISYITIAREQMMNSYFNMTKLKQIHPDGLPLKVTKHLHYAAKSIDNIVNGMNHVQRIYKNKDLIKQALEVLLQSNTDAYLKYLRLDNDPRYLFAELMYLYNKYPRLVTLPGNTEATVNKTVTNILSKSLGLEKTNKILDLLDGYGKVIKGDWKDYNLLDDKLDVFMKKTLDGPDIAVANYNKRLDIWNELAEDLNKFTIVSNAENDIITARSTMIGYQAKAMEDFLTLTKNKLNTWDRTTQRKFMQSLLDCSDAINVVKINQLLDLAPQDLLNVLCFQSGFIGFDAQFVNKYNPNIMQKLLTKKDELLQYGIEFKYNKITGDVFIYPNKSVKYGAMLDPVEDKIIYTINDEAVELFQLDDLNFGDLMQEALAKNGIEDSEIVEAFFKAQQSVNKVSNFKASGTTYEMVNRSFFEALPKLMPSEVINNISTSDFTNELLFKDRPRFNMTYLGSSEFRRRFNSSAKSDIVAGMMNTFSNTVKNATERFHYIDYAINGGFSLEELAKNCKNLGELTETLEKHPEFVLGAIMKNDKGEFILKRLNVNTEHEFELAKKFGAKIWDDNVFSKLESVINAKDWNDMNPFLRAYCSTVRLFKHGYLLSVGFFARNVIDTFMRNIALADGNPVETIKQTYRAMKLYKSYNDTVKILTDMAVDRSGILNRDTINRYFKYYADKLPMTKSEFDFAHSILNEGAFMGEVRSWQDYKAFLKNNKDANIKFEDTKEYKDAYDLFTTQKAYKNLFGSLNEDVENIQRLAGYLTMTDSGIPFTKAITELKATHFDYSNKTQTERMMELIIPFYSFKMKNLHYWLDSLEKHGWLYNVMMDFMRPIWNFDEYDQYELERNRSLQYNIKTGNIVFDNGLTFKLNPAIMDALQLVTDPIGSFGDSTMVWIQMLTDAMGSTALDNLGTKQQEFLQTYLNVNKSSTPQPVDYLKGFLNAVPYGAGITRAITGVEYAQDIDNPLPAMVPSLFGRVKRFEPYEPKQYTKKSYSGKRYSKKQRIAKPKRPRRYYTKKPRRTFSNYTGEIYPINFKQIYPDGMYSVPGISTYTAADAAKANRYYHFSRLPKLRSVSIYDKLYTSKGKARWDAMLQPVTSKNLKYVIRNTIHYK